MAGVDELVLKVDGKQLSGWTEIAVTRSLQAIPNSFQVSASEKSPVYKDASIVREGHACTVALGKDLVITGYCDQVVTAFSAGQHGVIVAGRGKCQDLVDCSAEWKGCQVSGSNALEIAQKLCKPYGITASCKDDPGPTVPQFNINVGDTPASILELVTRHAALLYYEGTDGNLILAEVGVTKAGSGFVEGQNVQAARVVHSQALRYSEYVCSLLSLDTSGLITDQDGLFYYTAKDPNVGRHRRLVIVAEGVAGGQELAQQRALWEASRRAGRSRAVTLTVDSWRDGKGKLWEPNTQAAITLPKLGLTDALWSIAEVTFRLGLDTGRTAEVLLMPMETFLPEPIKLQPVVGGVTGPSGQATGPAPAGG